jgi:hypothetical protein
VRCLKHDLVDFSGGLSMVTRSKFTNYVASQTGNTNCDEEALLFEFVLVSFGSSSDRDSVLRACVCAWVRARARAGRVVDYTKRLESRRKLGLNRNFSVSMQAAFVVS